MCNEHVDHRPQVNQLLASPLIEMWLTTISVKLIQYHMHATDTACNVTSSLMKDSLLSADRCMLSHVDIFLIQCISNFKLKHALPAA